MVVDWRVRTVGMDSLCSDYNFIVLLSRTKMISLNNKLIALQLHDKAKFFKIKQWRLDNIVYARTYTGFSVRISQDPSITEHDADSQFRL